MGTGRLGVIKYWIGFVLENAQNGFQLKEGRIRF